MPVEDIYTQTLQLKEQATQKEGYTKRLIDVTDGRVY